MRTTIEFDPDTAAAIEQLRREAGVGVSEAVNRLIRKGLLVQDEGPRFVQRTYPLGLKIDVTNVSEALDIIEGPDYR
jgi:hypothetical protein